MKYRLHPEAELDIAEAMDYYELKQTGLGHRFRKAVEAVIQELVEVTCAGPVVIADCRFRLTRNFPYIIFYRVQEDIIQIIGIVHDKREIDFILERIAD